MRLSASLAGSVALSVALSLCAAPAQQPGAPQKRVPQLTTEDVLNSRSGNAAAVPDSEIRTGQDAGWSRRSPGDFGLSLELPGEPLSMEIPLPDEVRRHFDEVRAIAYTDRKWALLIAHFAGSNPSEPKLLAAGLLEGVSRGAGVSDLEYSLEPRTNSRVAIKGHFSVNGVPVTLDGLIQTKGNNIWVAVAQHQKADAESQSAVRRMITSVRINPSH